MIGLKRGGRAAKADEVVIRQGVRGWWSGLLTIVAVSCTTLVLLERAFGIHGPASAQLWIIPVGLLAAALAWRTYGWLRPVRRGNGLTISPAKLSYQVPGKEPEVLERPAIGLIDVIGEPLSGRYTVTVYSQASKALGLWCPRWAGWREERVVRVLRDAGYPAARHRDIYDGRFQAQTPGTPPRTAR